MGNLVQSVILWAVLAILLHLLLVLGALIYRELNWWGSPWAKRLEALRQGLAVGIVVLLAMVLLIGCVNPCQPAIHQTLTPQGLLRDSGIGINCEWRF